MAIREYDVTRIREMFDYDPDSGILTWKVRPAHHFKSSISHKAFNTLRAGKATGYQSNKHLVANINGKPHLVHRLAWVVHYGRNPGVIDHINLNGCDNRLVNLRECTLSQNQHNRIRNSNNTSGFKNVAWHGQLNKWRAYIVLNYKQKHLGLFDTPEEAHAAFVKASAEMHGEFANHG